MFFLGRVFFDYGFVFMVERARCLGYGYGELRRGSLWIPVQWVVLIPFQRRYE